VIEEGRLAPDFELQSDTGESVRLSRPAGSTALYRQNTALRRQNAALVCGGNAAGSKWSDADF